ncbi:M24 family metallopeptidase [Halalkalibacter akibai]|uniref:Proline dipeptidase n=1 Tax=Halalkalibacter akibai (strain ATCC 43226 / DSM 21942 / CIP 109018 / JCM 9157 / 1139) TaxID=1236973 RepID=W4QQD7_HALA3|nr:Xaa-Pro peptidase family protein [Halalkalibacter akibai]GAE34132.1 proline dipeptidase [Halalkalibacter akibai JCM 9157]
MLHNRLQSIQHWIKNQKAAYGVIQGKANLFYLTGFRCDPHERLIALFVFPDKEPFLICPNMEKPLIKQAGFDFLIIGYSDHEDPWGLINKHLASMSLVGEKIAVEKDILSVTRLEHLQTLSPGLSFVSCDAALMELRLIKNSEEIAILREAAKLADFGVEVGVHALKQGRTEMEIIALIEFELKKKGIAEMSFGTLVLSGEQSANPHGKPSMKPVQEGEFILFDLGVVLEGYCSDITRTVMLGQPSEEQEKIYHTVLQAQEDTLSLCREGTILGDLDRKARSIITKAGYGDFFPHRIGHGLGTEVHELPSLNELNTDQLKVGMTFTIEPGIYVPSVGGVRIEDDVLVTSTGYECLTKYPKELQVIK